MFDAQSSAVGTGCFAASLARVNGSFLVGTLRWACGPTLQDEGDIYPWVARLRARKTDGNLIVLRTNMEAGHAGAAGRFDRLKEVALAYAFALTIVGAANLPAV